METFDGHVQVNRYDAEGLRHEMEEDGKLVQFIYRGNEIVAEKTDGNIIRLIRGYDLTADTVDPDTKLQLMAEAANQVKGKIITLDSIPELPGPVIGEQLLLPDLREGGYKSLADMMSPEEAARYEAYFTRNAPDMVIPGIKELEGIYLHHNNLTGVDEIQPWRAYYDDYGRLMARTGYNAGNKTAGIPNVHYHLFEWGKEFGAWKIPHEYASHLKGEFR